ncbi:MAG TPA: SGNH/GDSL hydrolase family protein [Rhodanobacteraceae bacterium]|nr:SGNH/GDSL hydrolase family protein [Rhodanobacteraceae bacterium]
MSTRRFLALGDSYTIGEGVAAEANWPTQLTRALAGDGIALAPPQIIAVTGWTTDELMAGIHAGNVLPPYALVSLSIGVNDQYRGRDAALFRAGFIALLERAVAFAGDEAGRVMVVSIPDWGVTPFARAHGHHGWQVGAEIDAFNALAQAETARLGAHFVDITGLSRAAGDAADMLAADGLHPSAAQYRRWLPPIRDAARACLRR